MSDQLKGDIPRCPSGEGHAWVSGRAELNDEEQLEIVSRQCRRCGYEDVFDEEEGDG